MERVLFAPRELPPLRPDVAADPVRYDAWVRRREADRQPNRRPRRAHPALHIVLTVVGEPGAATRVALRSLRKQTTRGWDVTMIVGARWDSAARATVRAARIARRARVVTAGDDASLRDLLQLGLVFNERSAVALMFDGDAWAPDAVSLLTAKLREHDVVYADEDLVDAEDRHVAPRLKPDYSPEFVFSAAYVGRPLAVRAGLLHGLDLVADDCAALEHECALHACAGAGSVHHVAEVLCHRSGPCAAPGAGPSHVQEALRRRGDRSIVVPGRAPGTFRVVRSVPAGTTASLIIPFRDQPRFLRTCVDSIRSSTDGVDAELVLVDNGSVEPETRSLVEALSRAPAVRVLSDPRPFNWARLNNLAARTTRSDVLVFLNNDIEAGRPGWLDALCAQALRADVAAAGARLSYPDRRLQHCGIVVGLTGAAGHPLAGLPEGAPGYLDMAVAARECSAVTGAALATRRLVFEELGGFDETLGVDLNDVDYCLRAAQHGYRTIYEPGAELVHYESPSRGTAGGTGDVVKFLGRWNDYILARDPYLNPHLTRDDPSCGLATPGEKEAWGRWHSTLMTT